MEFPPPPPAVAQFCLGISPHDAVSRVYDTVGTLIEVRRHKGDFKEQ